MAKNTKKAQLGGAKPFYNLPLSLLFMLVRPAGFEPAAYGFVVRRSVRAELRALMNLIEMFLPIKLYRNISQYKNPLQKNW